jgi:hypothetical protein
MTNTKSSIRPALGVTLLGSTALLAACGPAPMTQTATAERTITMTAPPTTTTVTTTRTQQTTP